MSSRCQSVLLKTPLPSGRKRYLSASDATESEIKKVKSDNSENDRLKIKVKRNLLNMDESTKSAKSEKVKESGADDSDKVDKSKTKSNQKSNNYITNKRLAEKNRKGKEGKKQ